MSFKSYCLQLFLIFAFVCTGPMTVSAYDMEEAVKAGLAANLNIKMQELAIQEAEKDKLLAWGNFLPTISFVQQKTHLVNDGDNAVYNTDYLDQDRDYQSMRLTQPIFSGFYGLSSVLKANYILKFQRAELDNQKIYFAYQIRQQFIQYLKLQDDLVKLQDSEGRLQKQLAAAQAFYDQQMAPKLHVMQAEVALAKARQTMAQKRTQQETVHRSLNQLLALDLEEPVEYSGSLEEMKYETDKTLEDYLHDAEERPDMKEARLNVDISEQELKRILSQNLPKVNLDFSYNKSNTEYDDPRYQDEDTQYWSSMISVSMNIFRGGQTIASTLKQRITIKRYKKNISELRSKVKMDVSNNYASLIEARNRIGSSTAIKEAATRSYERADRRYKVGLGTSVDVLNALDDVSRAETDIVQARADFQTIKAELEYLSGNLPDFPAVPIEESNP